jgi:hypothetical protein
MASREAVLDLLETALGVARAGGWAPRGETGPRENPAAPHDIAGALDCAAWATDASGRDVAAAVEILCAVMIAYFPERAGPAGMVLSAFYDDARTTGADCEQMLRSASRHLRLGAAQ